MAREAPVSVSAVSKALRDAYGVSPEMRAKVTAAIERLGYRRRPGPVRCAAGYDTVVDDDRGGARLMVDHLVSLGHRRIVHTTHPPGGLERPHVLAQTVRLDGFVAAMRRHGLEPDVIETSYTEECGHRAALEALTGSTPPTGSSPAPTSPPSACCGRRRNVA
ncbi:LacI family DNA-binding transcriptional regulator [Streptomyces sp. NPDC002491]